MPTENSLVNAREIGGTSSDLWYDDIDVSCEMGVSISIFLSASDIMDSADLSVGRFRRLVMCCMGSLLLHNIPLCAWALVSIIDVCARYHVYVQGLSLHWSLVCRLVGFSMLALINIRRGSVKGSL